MLKHGKITSSDQEHQQMVDPFVALLTDCLKSKYNKVWKGAKAELLSLETTKCFAFQFRKAKAILVLLKCLPEKGDLWLLVGPFRYFYHPRQVHKILRRGSVSGVILGLGFRGLLC